MIRSGPMLLLRVFLVGLVLVGGIGCQSGSGRSPSRAETPETTLTVFAAASLTDAFEAIAAAYEAAHPGITIQLNLAGSQQLVQQLRLGAPGDVFASANAVRMQAAVEAGRVASEAVQVFAQNQLVVITPADNPARIEQLADLAEPGLRLVLADAAVPAGRYTALFLEKASSALGASYEARVRANVASFEQNVRAVLTKVLLGEADAGIVYTSDVAGADAAHLGRLAIPEALNVTASYPIAPVLDSAHPEAARAFVAFVRSPDGRQFLARYGFLPPPAT